MPGHKVWIIVVESGVMWHERILMPEIKTIVAQPISLHTHFVSLLNEKCKEERQRDAPLSLSALGGTDPTISTTAPHLDLARRQTLQWHLTHCWRRAVKVPDCDRPSGQPPTFALDAHTHMLGHSKFIRCNKASSLPSPATPRAKCLTIAAAVCRWTTSRSVRASSSMPTTA